MSRTGSLLIFLVFSFSEMVAPLCFAQSAELPKTIAPSKLTILNNTALTLTPSNHYNLIFNLTLPENYHLNPKAPSVIKYWIDELGEGNVANERVVSTAQNFQIPSPKNLMSFTVRVESNIYFCRDDNKGLCLIRSISFTQPVVLGEAPNYENVITLNASFSAWLAIYLKGTNSREDASSAELTTFEARARFTELMVFLRVADAAVLGETRYLRLPLNFR